MMEKVTHRKPRGYSSEWAGNSKETALSWKESLQNQGYKVKIIHENQTYYVYRRRK